MAAGVRRLFVDADVDQVDQRFQQVFQLADQLARCERVEEAVKLLDTVLGTANELGLLSTTYSTSEQRATGNFPQSESHLNLIRVLDTLKVVQGRGAAQS